MSKKVKTFAAKVNHVWLKIYAEQCSGCSYDDKGVSIDTPEKQHEIINNCLVNLCSCLPSDWLYHSVCHYKDTYTDTDKSGDYAAKIRTPAVEKPHAHILIFTEKYDKNHHFNRVRLGTIIDWLSNAGINFREKLDDSILCDFQYTNRKKSGISCIITYHKHQTIEARDCDGKEQYTNDECFTNLTTEELTSYNDEYKRVFELKQDAPPTKLRELKDYLYKQAFDLGEQLGNFPEFWINLSREYGANLTYSKLQEAYNSGVEKYCISHQHETFPVCPIFIQSPAGFFKSQSTRKALSELLGYGSVYYPSNNSGAFDDLLPHHKAIVFDDFNYPVDLLNLCDTGTTQKRIYRRGSCNPHVFAQYIVFTHNNSLNEYLSEYYPDLCKNQLSLDAARSRFFQIRLDPKDGHIQTNLNYLRGRGQYKEDVEKLFALFLLAFGTAHKSFINPVYDIGDLSEFEDVLIGEHE